MSPLPPEHVARWLPPWRDLAEAALAAAQAPEAEPAQLAALVERSTGWASPFGHKRDQYVGAALIWSAKAFCRQDSIALRQTCADLLLEAALAFKARLERAARALEPDHKADAFGLAMVAGRRFRADIDDAPDPDEEG